MYQLDFDVSIVLFVIQLQKLYIYNSYHIGLSSCNDEIESEVIIALNVMLLKEFILKNHIF